MQNVYNVYLFGVYGADGKLRAVKIGQTYRDVETRRQEVQRHADKSACEYNKGIHVTLAYIETRGIDAGADMETGIHSLIQEQYSTIVRFPHSKDYFSIPRNMREKTIISRFIKCAKEYGVRNHKPCIKRY